MANYTWGLTATDILRYTGGTGGTSAQFTADVAPYLDGAAGEVNQVIGRWAGVDPSDVGSGIQDDLGDTHSAVIKDAIAMLAAGRYLRPKNLALAESLIEDGRAKKDGLRYGLPDARTLLSVEVVQFPEPASTAEPKRSLFDSREAFD